LKEIPVERADILSVIDNETRPTKTKSKKRRWREIEAIKDKYQLKKELSEMDMSLEFELDEMTR
jgi:hypothetical protein